MAGRDGHQDKDKRATRRGAPYAQRWRAYVRKHNELVALSAELAAMACAAGATYVIENPVDHGWVGSPHFSWKGRGHVPQRLMPQIRQLRRDTNPVWSSFAQCASGGEFQKWTTLMAGGPRAARLRAINDMRCEHASHARVARGGDLSGYSE